MYIEPIPRRISIQHQGTVSSNGIETSPGANHEIIFEAPIILNFLEVFAESADMNIKINDETNSHFLKRGEGKRFTEIQITKLTIVESGVDFRFSGAFY